MKTDAAQTVKIAIVPMLMTREQVASMLAVSGKTVDRMSAAGTLPSVTLPGMSERRWRRADVRRFVNELRAREEGSG